jgi:ribonuclease E
LPRIDLDAEEEAGAPEELGYSAPIRMPKEARGERGERSERSERGGERGERSEKPDRGRAARREKHSSEPPQVISVEMTPEEQDVYALMGISPLVLTSEPIKDPKSIVIAITPPGQTPRPNIQLPMAQSDLEEDLEEEFTSNGAIDLPEEVASERVSESDFAEPATETLLEFDPNGVEVGVDPSRRRRRRRSSTAISE